MKYFVKYFSHLILISQSYFTDWESVEYDEVAEKVNIESQCAPVNSMNSYWFLLQLPEWFICLFAKAEKNAIVSRHLQIKVHSFVLLFEKVKD